MTLELVPPPDQDEEEAPVMTPVIIIMDEAEPADELIEMPATETEQSDASLVMALVRKLDRLQTSTDRAVRLLEQLVAARDQDRRTFNQLDE